MKWDYARSKKFLEIELLAGKCTFVIVNRVERVIEQDSLDILFLPNLNYPAE